jgi:signal transduction histidine kinase
VKSPGFRTQLIAVAGLIFLYAVGVGASFRLQAREHARLDAQLRESLAVLSSLPNLRDRLRRIDEETSQFLLTGQRSWLDKREQSLDDVRAIERELQDVAGEDGRRAIAEFDRLLTAYFAESGEWVARRRLGRLTPAEAARAALLGRRLGSAAEPLAALGDAQAAQLRERGPALERVSVLTAELVVLAGAAAALFIALFLSRYLTGPVSELRARAKDWTLGREWPAARPAASPEVADLFDAMRDMALRLNAQFAREAELGKLKGSLVSMASHEFNNALSVLGGTASLLKMTETPEPSGRRAEYYTVIEANLRALAISTGNLLDLGRLEDGRFAVRPRRADLARVLGDAEQALRPLYERKKLRLALEIPADAPPALGDPEALLLVATNLLGNAIKYTPEGRDIRAGVGVEADGRVRLFVADSGIGIAPEDRERIQHGDRTPAGRKAASGFGVGLTIVKRVLDAHGAALEIDGAPGRGSRFSFALPRWTEPTSGDLFV